MKIPIRSLLSKPQGATEDFTFEEKFELDPADETRLLSSVKGEISLIRLPHEITVSLDDVEVLVEAHCSRCTKFFEYKLLIPHAERQFIADLSHDELVENEDVFYLQKGAHEIDISTMMREEILLHFPHLALCYAGCKGLCSECGKDLNDGSCTTH